MSYSRAIGLGLSLKLGLGLGIVLDLCPNLLGPVVSKAVKWKSKNAFTHFVNEWTLNFMQ